MTEELKTISPVFQGGIGNNLYQIAVTISLSIENNAVPVFIFQEKKEKKHYEIFGGHDVITKENLPVELHEIFPKLPFIKIHHSINDFIKGKDYYKEKDMYSFHRIPFNEKNLIIDGFFFATQYFEKNLIEILKYLEPEQVIFDYIHQKYGNLFINPTVGVHYRFGNKNDVNKTQKIPLSWYKRIFRKFSASTIFIICSDNIPEARKFFNQLNTKHQMVYIENEPMYVDLFILSKCLNIVTHCSTFSAWAAFLNENEHKKVFVYNPDFKLIHGRDAIPEDWIDIDGPVRTWFKKYYINKNYRMGVEFIKKLKIFNFLIPVKRTIVKTFFKTDKGN